MTKAFALCAGLASLLAVLPACSPEETPTTAAQPRTAQKPKVIAVTEIGVPTAAPVIESIGSDGGRLTSADGNLTLSIPADAVSAPTDFTVTPIETQSPGGVVSYRLGPEGVTFANKVTLTFKYTDADAAGSHSSLLNIVYQDSEQRWRRVAAVVDDGAKTVSTQTTHFSDWSMVRGLQIRPPEAVVTVKESVKLTVQVCEYVEPDSEFDLQSLAYACHDTPDDLAPIIWAHSVNGIAGGNAAVGRVTKGLSFHYIAPEKPPAINPVTVSVETRNLLQEGGGSKRIMVALVTVVTKDKRPPEDTLPKRYSGSGKISVKSGGEGSAASLLNYDTSYDITGGQVAGSAVGEFTLRGTLTVTGGAMELPNCKCSITGGSAPAEAGLGVDEPGKQQSLAVSAFVTVGISCTPSEGRRSCPASSVVPVMWSNNGGPQCPGSTITTFTNVRELSGGYQRTCGSRYENATWSLRGD